MDSAHGIEDSSAKTIQVLDQTTKSQLQLQVVMVLLLLYLRVLCAVRCHGSINDIPSSNSTI